MFVGCLTDFYQFSPTQRLPRRMKMGTICVRTFTSLVFGLLLISSAQSFYLPGVAPRDFQIVCSDSIPSLFLASSTSIYALLSLYSLLTSILFSKFCRYLVCVKMIGSRVLVLNYVVLFGVLILIGE